MALARMNISTKVWWCLGTALVLCNIGLWALAPDFHYDSPFAQRPIPTATILLLVASVVYVVVFQRARAEPPSLRFVFVIAVLARLPMLFANPIQEDDIHRYVWDGRVAANGLDPYAHSPEEISGYEQGDGAFLPDQLERLAALTALKNSTPALTRVFERVNNPAFATIYPPVTEAIFAIHGLLVPPHVAAEWQVVWMKMLLGVFDLLVLAGLVVLLSITKKPLGLCVLYAWCPLVFKEISNSGHMDAIPTAFVVLAICAQCRRRALLYGALLAMAAAAKFYAILLLPLGLRTLGWRRSAMCLAAFACTTLAAGLLFPRGDGRHDQTVVSFALGWENHDAVFFWLYGAWTLLVGDADLTLTLRGASFVVGKGYFLTLITVAIVTILAVARVTWRFGSRWQLEELPRAAFTILATVFLLGPLGFPWYFTWCVPLLPFVRLNAWCILPGLLMSYYLRFWYDYQYADGYAGFQAGTDFFDYVVASVEFGVFYVILLLEAWLARKKPSML